VAQVLYGSAAGLAAAGNQLWSQDSPGIAGAAEDFDFFGDTLAAGDFNGDSTADLAIAAPGENDFAGVVHVLYGSAPGLVGAGSQLWSQDNPGVAGTAEGGDELGLALTAGDLNGDGQSDLAIGAPAESFSGLQSAGVVHVLYGSAAGLVAAGSQLWSQDSPGIANGAEDFDFFGDSLAAGSLSTGDSGTTTVAGRRRGPASPGRR
jgi:disulfide bond formation protein DsbB